MLLAQQALMCTGRNSSCELVESPSTLATEIIFCLNFEYHCYIKNVYHGMLLLENFFCAIF